MKKENIIYYSVLFAAGATMALWFRREYFKMKESARTSPPKGKLVSFGVRG